MAQSGPNGVVRRRPRRTKPGPIEDRPLANQPIDAARARAGAGVLPAPPAVARVPGPAPGAIRARLAGLLAGRPGDMIRAGIGACIGIFLTGLLSEIVVSQSPAMMRLLLIAPMGAAAVLLFAVPTSPLAQPWSVIGGNTISALVGVICLKVIGFSLLGAGVAVGAAIALMIALRCLHPPGGAAALSAVLGGPMLGDHAFSFVGEVLLNAALLLAAAAVFNNLTGRPYPHRPQAAPTPALPFRPADVRPSDVAAALRDLESESLTIDLTQLDRLAAQYATRRALGTETCGSLALSCSEAIRLGTTLDQARRLMARGGHDRLAVIDAQDRYHGILTRGAIETGLRGGNALVPAFVSRALNGSMPAGPIETVTIARPKTRLSALGPDLLEGRVPAVPLIDERGAFRGFITRADLERRLKG